MRTVTKVFLIIAASLTLAGLILFGGAMIMMKWDFTNFFIPQYETNEYTVTEDYKSISLSSNTADIVFLPSENESTSVVCYEQKNVKHSVTVTEDTLTVTVNDTRKWYEFISFLSRAPKITVYLPQSEYATLTVKESTGDITVPQDFTFTAVDITVSTGDVRLCASASDAIKIRATTGDINVGNLSAASLDISLSTGDVTVSHVTCTGDFSIKVTTGDTELSDVTCKTLTSTGSTGDLELEHVIAEEKLVIERSTGDVELDDTDAAEIFIKTDTGDVTGRLLSEKVFITKTDTGRINVPNSITGGRCEITTDTGNIRITVSERRT